MLGKRREQVSSSTSPNVSYRMPRKNIMIWFGKGHLTPGLSKYRFEVSGILGMNSILVLSFPCKSRAAYLSMFRNSAVFSPAAVIWIAIALAAAATAVSDRIKQVLGLPGGGDPPWLSGRQVRLETLPPSLPGKIVACFSSTPMPSWVLVILMAFQSVNLIAMGRQQVVIEWVDGDGPVVGGGLCWSVGGPCGLVLPCPCAASAALERTRGHHQPVLSRAPHHLVVGQTASLNSAFSCHLERFQQFVPSCQVANDETGSSGTWTF